MTKRKKEKRRARALAEQTGSKYTAALAAERDVDPELKRARAHRRELVQLAEDWVAGRPLDQAVLRRVAMRPLELTHLDRVQQEIPFPDAAWPEFIGVMFRASKAIHAEYTPTPYGPRPEDPAAGVRRLLDALWERVNLTKRARAEALDGLSVSFESHYGGLLRLLSFEAGLCSSPLSDAVLSEVQNLSSEIDQLHPRELHPREPESSAA